MFNYILIFSKIKIKEKKIKRKKNGTTMLKLFYYFIIFGVH